MGARAPCAPPVPPPLRVVCARQQIMSSIFASFLCSFRRKMGKVRDMQISVSPGSNPVVCRILSNQAVQIFTASKEHWTQCSLNEVTKSKLLFQPSRLSIHVLVHINVCYTSDFNHLISQTLYNQF